MKYRVVFYQTNRGDSPVVDYLSDLDKSISPKYFKLIELLGEFGPKLGMPYSRKLTKNLNELRTRGRNPIRVIYTNIDNIYVILNAFLKKTNKTPMKEIRLAESRRLTLI